MKKKYIIPLIAFFAFVAGMIFMMVPFLPFGWLLIFMTAFLLLPYIKPVKKLLVWLIKKDKTGTFEKARDKVAQLYHWAGDKEGAREVSNISEETIDNKQGPAGLEK